MHATIEAMSSSRDGSWATALTPAGSRAALPIVMRTRETTASAKETPRNENVSAPATFGTKNVPSEMLAALKN